MLGEPAIKEYGNEKMPKGRKEYLEVENYNRNARMESLLLCT